MGVSPRCLELAFDLVKALGPEMERQYKFYVSMFQIYNEKIYDLINFIDDDSDKEKN